MKAYEFLLGRIVIADDMDHAIKMAKNSDPGLKFVTLDGEVIGGTGAITGGRFKNRTANLLERKAEIIRLGESLEKLEKNIKNQKPSL